ncbi:MAG: hypothetical protein ABIJ53_09600, partial [Verrucomicrobiota bacterium]
NSKIQVPNSKEIEAIKAKAKNGKKTGFILSLLEFYYSLEFGFWNLEFLELLAQPAWKTKTACTSPSVFA